MADTKKTSREINRLSARRVETAKPGMHHDGGGLYLQVTENGARSWLFRYAIGSGNKRREHQIGLGPVSIVSLSDARFAAAECRRQRWQGKDPLTERRAAKLAAQLERAKAVTFKAAGGQYIEAQKPGWKNAKHAAQWTATLERYAYPILGESAVQDVDVALMMKVLEQTVPAEKGKPAGSLWTARPETASRVRGRIENILDWAATREYRKGENPARWKGHLENLLPKKSKVAKVEHHPALPYTQIGDFMPKLRHKEGISAEALEFTILCATRTNETTGAKPDEFDVDAKVWTIPAARMKADTDHRVPLSDAALAIVKKRIEAGGAYLFPGGKKGEHLSNAAMLELMRDMKRDDGKRWSDEKGRAAVPHGFRSTFRDWAADCTNFPNHVVEMALAHTIDDKTEAAYRRSDLFEKRRRLMDAWEKFCNRPAKASAGNVTAIRAAASA